MAVGDMYRYSDGRSYAETEHGPNVWWHCQDCGERAAVHLEATVCRCQRCWARLSGVDIGQQQWLAQDQYRRSTPNPKVRRDLFYYPRTETGPLPTEDGAS